MKYEEILENLKSNKTVVVANTWYFTGRAMNCSNTEDFSCCEDWYDSFEEAANMAVYMGNKDGTNIRVL